MECNRANGYKLVVTTTAMFENKSKKCGSIDLEFIRFIHYLLPRFYKGHCKLIIMFKNFYI